MTLSALIDNLTPVLPECILVLAICVVLIADMCTPLSKSASNSGMISLAGVGLALAAVIVIGFDEITVFDRSFICDRLSQVFKLLMFGATFVGIAMAMRSRSIKSFKLGEMYSLILGMALGGAVLASAGSYVIFVLGFEMLSLCSYVLAGYLKRNRASAEAAVKYTIYGALSSGMMFFGFGYLYGLTGTLDIEKGLTFLTAESSIASGQLIIVAVSAALILAGLAYKMALVPFHFWCPDVYQGAPTPVTALLSVVSKAAGFAGLLRLMMPLLSAQADGRANSDALLAFQVVLGVLAILTMTLGNFGALRQQNVKRMLAYSSIAHAGYLLMAISVLNIAGVHAAVVYLVLYVFMNLSAFWGVEIVENERGKSDLEQFKGLGRLSPLFAAAMFVCLIALTGLPPTAGFSGKFLLFQAVVSSGLEGMSNSVLTGPAVFFLVLALIGVLNSVVSLFYYMKITKAMVFEEADEGVSLSLGVVDKSALVVLGLPLLLLLNFSPVFSLVSGTM